MSATNKEHVKADEQGDATGVTETRGKRKRGGDVHGHWSSTDRFAETLAELGSGDTVLDRSKQKALVNIKFRWILEISRPNGILESKQQLATAVGTMDDEFLSWRLEIKTSYKAHSGWVPWLRVKPSDTNTGYRVYALREFRKGELVGWFYGERCSAVPSAYRKHNIDAGGSTDCFAGMGLHLLSDPTVGISDPDIVSKVQSLVNVLYEEDGAVVSSKNICVNDEIRGQLG